MPITYYPDSVYKRVANPIDLLQKSHKTYSWSGGADLDEGALSTLLWPGLPAWTLKQISLFFGSSYAKDYSISKVVGRGVIAGLNDRLWFKANGAPPQRIIIAPGFYNPFSFVNELKAKLDANKAFTDLGLAPFSVVFTFSTGLFEITPNAGDIQFFFRMQGKPDIHATSNGGYLIGLSQDTSLASSITSDTPCIEFGVSFEIVSATGSDATDVSLTDDFCMSNDDAILVSASGDMIASYSASYKED